MRYVRAFAVLYVFSFALFAYLDYKKEPPQGGIRGGSQRGNCNALTLGRRPA